MIPRLGINIDHVATLRQARGGSEPCPVQAALVAQEAGADGITLHLREDRRHVQEQDLRAIARQISVPVNLELALDPEVVAIAIDVAPRNCCLVPERRQEITTEGGLDVLGAEQELAAVVDRLGSAGSQVQIFVDPDIAQIEACARIGARGVELHTGEYANARGEQELALALQRIEKAALAVRARGLHLHAGHGLNYENVIPVARLQGMEELNIGHAIIAQALFVGLGPAVSQMKSLIARSEAAEG